MPAKAWSTFSNVPAIPDTLDFEGPNAIPEVQALMIRFTGHLTEDLTVAIAAEAPNGQIEMPTGASPGSEALNQYPDVIVRSTWAPGQSTVQISGIYRRLRAIGTRIVPGTTAEVPFNSATNAWGGQFSGNLAFNQDFLTKGGWFGRWFGRDSLQYGLVLGEGLGAYIQDLSGLNLDAAPTNAVSSQIEAIRVLTAWGGLEHFWTDNLRSTATFGTVRTLQPPNRKPSDYKSALYVSGNLILSIMDAVDVGAEYIYGNRVTEGDGSGHNSRLQLSSIWHYGL